MTSVKQHQKNLSMVMFMVHAVMMTAVMNAETTAVVAVDAETNEIINTKPGGFPVRVRWADFLVLLIALCCAYASIVQLAGQGKPALVSIKTPTENLLYPLDEDRTIIVHGKQGDTIVVIAHGSAQVTESACRDKLCVLAGALSKPGQWTACLPNGVYVQITGKADNQEIDALVK